MEPPPPSNQSLSSSSSSSSFNDSKCGHMDDNYMEVWSQMQYWCEGILFTAFGVVGLVANTISVAVLGGSKEMRKHSFNQLLIALALFDMMFIVVSVPVYSFSMFQILVGNKFFSLLYVNFLYPMSPVTLCASVYMTLAITIERYLAVCKPLVYRNLNTTMSSFRRVAMYVLPVAVLSVCLNIPKFLETQAKIGDNSTEIGIADMRLEPTYMLYYTISQIFHPTLTTGILPMAALIYMNMNIFLGIRRTMAKRAQRRRPQTTTTATTPTNTNNTNSRSSPNKDKGKTSETNLAVVLIGIVLMHLACHTLRVFLAGLAVHLIRDTVHCMRDHGGFVPPLWSMCAESVSSLLIMVNMSGNFLIYCSVLTPFKKSLATLWDRCSKCSSSSESDSFPASNNLVNKNGCNEGKQERPRTALVVETEQEVEVTLLLPRASTTAETTMVVAETHGGGTTLTAMAEDNRKSEEAV